MFDNVNLSKSYTLDDLYGNSVEVCTFNANLSRVSGISAVSYTHLTLPTKA